MFQTTNQINASLHPLIAPVPSRQSSWCGKMNQKWSKCVISIGNHRKTIFQDKFVNCWIADEVSKVPKSVAKQSELPFSSVEELSKLQFNCLIIFTSKLFERWRKYYTLFFWSTKHHHFQAALSKRISLCLFRITIFPSMTIFTKRALALSTCNRGFRRWSRATTQKPSTIVRHIFKPSGVKRSFIVPYN